MVGYQLSPLLRKKITRHATAGRVQSVAVRLIVEKEREIQAFKSEEYWKITGTFMPVDLAAKVAPDFFKKLRDAEAKRKEEAANKNVGKHDDVENDPVEAEGVPRVKQQRQHPQHLLWNSLKSFPKGLSPLN